nr:nose resistant to fluoxetine protein 6 [Leptinotarsa decemlineata]
MYDSTAKLPSGILNGNINQFGDFDMCLGAYSESQNIRGQYCLASIEVKAPQSSYLTGLYSLIHAHHHFKSRLEDPGHRVPRFSSINWALCVPSACSPREVELGLRRTVNRILEGTEIQIRYEVDPAMCQKKVEFKIPLSTYITVSVFAALIVWEIFATVYDHYVVENKNRWIVAFSLKENFMNSISLKRSPGDIEAVHGIRCLNAILLLASHKSMATFFLPYSNRTEYVEYVGRPFSVMGRAASLYTDPFIMMSGMLTTYSLLGRLNRDKKINVLQEYVSRLFRIVPTFAAVIAFCTFVLPWTNNGPLWNLVVTHHSDICKKYWWRNLMFIHNYFGFKEMCLTHTHHIGIDTQLFFISPVLIYLIWRWPKRGSIALTALAIISTIMRFYVSYTLKLSNYVHFGTSVQQLFNTADYMYILPAHRATVYIMGIFLGYILRNFSNMYLSKTQINIGNTLALCSFCISFLGPAFMGKIDYVYDPLDGAWYAAFSPILWCFSFAWIIFTWHLGYKGLPGLIFSNKLFTLWTKISYTVYLTQFPTYFYNVGSTRSSSEAGFFRLIFNLKEYAWVIVLSIILTLTFEIPFQNVRQILLKIKQGGKGRPASIPEEKQKVS